MCVQMYVHIYKSLDAFTDPATIMLIYSVYLLQAHHRELFVQDLEWKYPAIPSCFLLKFSKKKKKSPVTEQKLLLIDKGEGQDTKSADCLFLCFSSATKDVSTPRLTSMKSSCLSFTRR